MAIGFRPVVQMNLVEIRGHEFFPQRVGFTAQERHLKPSEYCDQPAKPLTHEIEAYIKESENRTGLEWCHALPESHAR
jgi:hypothetical protein